MLTATPTHVQHALSLPPQSQLILVNDEGTPVHSYRKKSIEHTCGNNNGKAQTTTSPLRACRRLEKRNSSRVQSNTNDTISATPEDSNNGHPKESLLASGKYDTVSAPMVRSRTLDTRTERVMEQCRRSSAPPQMQNDAHPSQGPEAESSSHEKVEKWLRTQSRENVEQQLGSSAPPRLVVQPPDEISPTEEAKERYWPSSSPVRRYQASDSLCIPGPRQITISGNEADEVHSPSQDCPRIWRATIGNKEYEVTDVTSDVTDIVRTEGDEGGFGYVRRGTLHGQDIALKEMKLSYQLPPSKKSEMKKSKA
ncbi:uncharacterized protein FOMMEDRAFT_131225 [Fomitiporia mediterranea MF3/22]|uniref:uncharacterized protein n=1 Tax=Fomitiporia mediterranea (strain MF3/22) TaxID=694068 RepID=UPI0004409C0F|nr:uncharacterized protein FOMMEDRAFT_131225 [Fomitiporia mediterranea MF3/22]EJD08483.1 hypothetical protein FOMMEDRAFT_131225 [Fomitiporia mediterranea MF3/22]